MRLKQLSIVLAMAVASVANVNAQDRRVYDETIDPMAQIDAAVTKANAEGKHVICQVGGNWCPWCLRLAEFVKTDSLIAATIDQNYVYIHVNYPRHDAAKPLMQRLGNAGRFGYPALVVLDDEGNVAHIQDSSFLEQGKGYDPEKVLRFLRGWTPAAIKTEQ